MLTTVYVKGLSTLCLQRFFQLIRLAEGARMDWLAADASGDRPLFRMAAHVRFGWASVEPAVMFDLLRASTGEYINLDLFDEGRGNILHHLLGGATGGMSHYTLTNIVDTLLMPRSASLVGRLPLFQCSATIPSPIDVLHQRAAENARLKKVYEQRLDSRPSAFVFSVAAAQAARSAVQSKQAADAFAEAARRLESAWTWANRPTLVGQVAAHLIPDVAALAVEYLAGSATSSAESRAKKQLLEAEAAREQSAAATLAVKPISMATQDEAADDGPVPMELDGS